MKSHLQRETDLLAKHGEFKKDFSDLEEQLDLITRDSTTLENSFDELHQLYVKQKAVHQCLFDRNKVIQQYMAELKSWTREDGESKEEMQRELRELEQRSAGCRIFPFGKRNGDMGNIIWRNMYSGTSERTLWLLQGGCPLLGG